MNLTPTQVTALVTDINSAQRAAVWATEPGNSLTLHDAAFVANFYNSTANPVVNVWLTSVPVMPTLNAAIVWSAYETLSVALQNTYMAITQSGVINMADKAAARGLVGLNGQTDGVFVDGSASSLAIRAASVRAATYAEALFSALGLGTLGTAGAATVGNVCQYDANGNSIFGQQLQPSDVSHAMGW